MSLTSGEARRRDLCAEHRWLDILTVRSYLASASTGSQINVLKNHVLARKRFAANKIHSKRNRSRAADTLEADVAELNLGWNLRGWNTIYSVNFSKLSLC